MKERVDGTYRESIPSLILQTSMHRYSAFGTYGMLGSHRMLGSNRK